MLLPSRTIDVTLDLRSMTTDDADAVAALFQSAHADGGAGGWKIRDIAHLLDEGGAGVIAFAPGNTGPAGAVLAMRVGADMDIVNIAVGNAFRRRSLGRNLLNLLAAQAESSSYERILLEVADDNTVARAFYEAMEFNIVGTRPAYYPRDGYRVDAKIMARTLNTKHSNFRLFQS